MCSLASLSPRSKPQKRAGKPLSQARANQWQSREYLPPATQPNSFQTAQSSRSRPRLVWVAPTRFWRRSARASTPHGHPRHLTTLHPIAAGDMWGVKGIDHIAKAGCLARVLAGSYPSGPSSAEPPAIWKMISDDAIPCLQCALWHSIRHPSRGGGEAAWRVDQSRHGYVRRP